ncbi:MAG: DNA gyrase subunit A, partial [Rhodomicrobium sp.]|nr:DNA gyrase subunit A [Rhodomicrobium sp.]
MPVYSGDQIVEVAVCRASDDVLLTSAGGRCIRFPVEDVRLFKGRDSTGVRGIRLDEGDAVIAMAILAHMDAAGEERAAFLKQAAAVRRAQSAEEADEIEGVADPDGEGEDAADALDDLSPERYAQLSAREQMVLTLSERGFGKRSSSYEFRVTGRGGKGIVAMVVNDRNGPLIASFPVEDSDQIMLVTDAGQMIRCPVDDVRIAGRNTQGVRIFRTDADESV